MISLIVAASRNNAIGKNNQLLWHLPKDLKFFKNTTWGMPVIMGRKTFEAVGKPLPGRTNIVITSNENFSAAGVLTTTSLEQALQKARETNGKEIFIIGGGNIYRQTMDIADRIYMTRVHADIEGDTFFPEMEESQWTLQDAIDIPADEKHAYPFTIETWQKNG
jgi:dihydrofolate reductase